MDDLLKISMPEQRTRPQRYLAVDALLELAVELQNSVVQQRRAIFYFDSVQSIESDNQIFISIDLHLSHQIVTT